MEWKRKNCFCFLRASLSIKRLSKWNESIEKGAKHRLIMSGLKLLSGLKMAWMSLSFLLPYTDGTDSEAKVACGVWVLHIAKVGSIPSPYLGNVEEQKS